jgi:hypothetical protein
MFLLDTNVISELRSGKPRQAASGFHLFFSAHPFPGYQLELNWQRSEFDGNWYHSEVLDMEGWLCPALLKYFDDAPKTIYAQFKQRKP